VVLRVGYAGPLKGEIRPPGDKSISHRALMLGALAQGETRIRGLLEADDIARTAHCLREMGVPIWPSGEEVIVEGRGEEGLAEPWRLLEAGNSGTTLRLLMGMIASHPFRATLTGDASLRRRPMDRVAIPLRQMGAEVEGEGPRCLPPVKVRGGSLRGIEYHLLIASAQVKSAILLAGLRAKGETRLTEPAFSRDHTERMLRGFGAPVQFGPGFAAIVGGGTLQGQRLVVPGDFSAAAFFIVGAALLEGSEVEIQQVGLNPTRTGLLEVLQEMGADLEISPAAEVGAESGGEPTGRVRVRGGSPLRGTEIGPELVPRLIDELPVLCVAAAGAEGKTVIRGAGELRLKESDRISAMAAALVALGADVEELPDGLIIRGGRRLKAARIDSRGDHRVAMAGAIAGVLAQEAEIEGAECISTSYPGFAEHLRLLGGRVEMIE